MKLQRIYLAQTARPIDVFFFWRKEGYLNLSPPYQRGDVWGSIRRQNLIKSILLGVPIPSIIINDRFSANWGEEMAVIDGKQRITTILMLMDDELKIPGEWVGQEKDLIKFSDLPKPEQRGFRSLPLQTCEGQLKSIEEEKEIFELINFGGVPQGESDN